MHFYMAKGVLNRYDNLNIQGTGMIRIAFFDIDGTLLPLGKKELSPRTRYALQQLQKNGILLCMATGRSYVSIPHFEGIEFDVFLTFNGSYVRNKEGVIRKNPLDRKDARRILKNLKNMNRAAAISNEDLVVTNGTDKELAKYFAFGNAELVIAENFEELCKKDIYQIMCSCTKEEYDQILRGTGQTEITAWWEKAADIIPSNGGKGRAVQEVLEYYHFERGEAIAFGDGKNDITMLEKVGTGIAMGNAPDEVKKKADAICKSVDEDGVYFYCLENKLIKSGGEKIQSFTRG